MALTNTGGQIYTFNSIVKTTKTSTSVGGCVVVAKDGEREQ